MGVSYERGTPVGGLLDAVFLGVLDVDACEALPNGPRALIRREDARPGRGERVLLARPNVISHNVLTKWCQKVNPPSKSSSYCFN